MILTRVMQMRLAAGLAIGLAAAPVMIAQEATPGQATTIPPATTAPLSKSQMKEQRKQQKSQEKAAKEAAKAQKDSANALKHQNNATNAQEKAAQHAPPPETAPATTTPPPQV
jgi:hypothetical protein